MPQLILYACPIGPLAEQLETYFEKSQQICGPNAAHAYMPHCTLTGFFNDEESAIALYTDTLDTLLSQYCDRIPRPAVVIKQLTFRPDWHGLELEADWLKQLAADFAIAASTCPESTRTESLRLKDWLHLSLAYEFNPTHEISLKHLADELIDIAAPVDWELRFYQRSPNNNWHCHSSQRLSS